MYISGIGIELPSTDQGTEYVSREIQDYLKFNGIIQNPTGIATNAQMHLTERINRNLE